MRTAKTFFYYLLMASTMMLSVACASETKPSAPLLWISGKQLYKLRSVDQAWKELTSAAEVLKDVETIHQFGNVEPDGDWNLILEYQDGNDLILRAKTAQKKLASKRGLEEAKVFLWYPSVEIARVHQTQALPATEVTYAQGVFLSAERVPWLENYAVIPEIKNRPYRKVTFDSTKAEALGIDLAAEKPGIDAFLADRKNNLFNYHSYKLEGKDGQKVALTAVADIAELEESLFADGNKQGVMEGVYFANPEEVEAARESLRKFYDESLTALEEDFDFEQPLPFQLEEITQFQPWAVVFVPQKRKAPLNLSDLFQGHASVYQLEGNNFLLDGKRGTACFVQAKPGTSSTRLKNGLTEKLSAAGHKGSVEVLNFHPWKYFPPAVVPQ